jgi:mannose-6-phosphate isomerase-like protein (cupin superfamily)
MTHDEAAPPPSLGTLTNAINEGIYALSYQLDRQIEQLRAAHEPPPPEERIAMLELMQTEMVGVVSLLGKALQMGITRSLPVRRECSTILQDEAIAREVAESEQRLTTLAELTEMLPELPHGSPPQVRYHGGKGEWIGAATWWEVDGASQVCDAAAGVVLPAHEHTVCEWLHVMRGAISVCVDGATTVYRAGGCVGFEPGQWHRVTTLEQTRLIAVTIPAEECYPHGHDHTDAATAES